MVVQELVSYPGNRHDLPLRFIEDYELEELFLLTTEYQQRVDARVQPRQALNEGGGVYIAANLTEEDFRSGFVLGDSGRYQSFVNHPLLPQIFYNVTLRGTVSGTDIFLTSSGPIST